MSRSMWDHYGSPRARWRVGNTDWSTDGRRIASSDAPWIAMSPAAHDNDDRKFATHAEAITYAQEQAKTQALKEPS